MIPDIFSSHNQSYSIIGFSFSCGDPSSNEGISIPLLSVCLATLMALFRDPELAFSVSQSELTILIGETGKALLDSRLAASSELDEATASQMVRAINKVSQRRNLHPQKPRLNPYSFLPDSSPSKRPPVQSDTRACWPYFLCSSSSLLTMPAKLISTKLSTAAFPVWSRNCLPELLKQKRPWPSRSRRAAWILRLLCVVLRTF
jgi:hypothetical protein